ncbi:hypothetical protein HPULCUR_000918 [Helicostylum pulchrum]|uniref:Uncharacterized protein n=1 Tax=Helicostylum pulchrum TaxID=562976 RepID=A0ABP9XM81_9FUNG
MELLPTNKRNDSSRRFKRSSSVPLILSRLVRFPQMDFEFALWQMAYLLIAPRRVYRNIYYHKQTKNQWARDDPAFLVLLASLLCLSAVAWGLVIGLGMIGILRAMLFMVIVDFVLVGSMVATFTWFVTNRFLSQSNMMTNDQRVEWAYAFDIHLLPFLVHTELLLYPIISFIVGFIVLTVFGINIGENVIGFYFGWS